MEKGNLQERTLKIPGITENEFKISFVALVPSYLRNEIHMDKPCLDPRTGSLQNISYAMRELEEKGLIRCITSEKGTWKKFIPTEKGTEVFEKLKKNNLIGN